MIALLRPASCWLNLLFRYYVFVCIPSGRAIPEMIYTVSGGTLNPTHSLTWPNLRLKWPQVDGGRLEHIRLDLTWLDNNMSTWVDFKRLETFRSCDEPAWTLYIPVHTGWGKNGTIFVRLITSPNINRLSKFFYCQNHETICNKTLAINPTTP